MTLIIQTVTVLSLAGFGRTPFVYERPEKSIPATHVSGVYLSPADQLLGTYDDLKAFQRSVSDSEFFGWHAHHIVQELDLERLGVARLFPPGGRQTCVLLPERAHVGRIHSVLNRLDPYGVRASPLELRGSYRLAYAMMGDYTGRGEQAIKAELMRLVDTILKMARLI